MAFQEGLQETLQEALREALQEALAGYIKICTNVCSCTPWKAICTCVYIWNAVEAQSYTCGKFWWYEVTQSMGSFTVVARAEVRLVILSSRLPALLAQMLSSLAMVCVL